MVVPVHDCLYAALFALNVATCFGDGVDGELVGAMRAAQQEFLRFLPRARVFSTFQKAAGGGGGSSPTANLVRRPDIQTRLRGEVEAAEGGGDGVPLCLRRHHLLFGDESN